MLKNEDSYRITSFASCRGRLCSVVAVAIKAFHSTSDQTRRCHLGVVGVFFFFHRWFAPGALPTSVECGAIASRARRTHTLPQARALTPGRDRVRTRLLHTVYAFQAPRSSARPTSASERKSITRVTQRCVIRAFVGRLLTRQTEPASAFRLAVPRVHRLAETSVCDDIALWVVASIFITSIY